MIVPSYEAAPYLRTCIRSVLAYTPDRADWNLVIVDNGSGPEVAACLDEVEAHDRISVVRVGDKLGFTGAVNLGLAEAGSERDAVLLNNDAFVTPGWIDAMWQVLADVDDAGIVVPRQVLPPGIREVRKDVPGASRKREVDVSLSASTRNVIDPFFDVGRGYVELSFAPFFCVMLRAELLEEAGPLNAEHGPHYRSDRLYCDLARHFAGRRIIYTPHSKVYHFHNRSTRHLKQTEPESFSRMVRDHDWPSES